MSYKLFPGGLGDQGKLIFFVLLLATLEDSESI